MIRGKIAFVFVNYIKRIVFVNFPLGYLLGEVKCCCYSKEIYVQWVCDGAYCGGAFLFCGFGGIDSFVETNKF